MSDWETFTALSESTQVEQLAITLREIVAERGDEYVYPSWNKDRCRYVHHEQPSCLVGVALYRLGLPLAELEAWDDAENAGIAAVAPSSLSPATCKILATVQARQDAGDTWATAVKEAIETV